MADHKLKDKQELFCNEYLIDLNATQAAIRAGYSERTAQEQSSRLLSNVMVSSRVAELMQIRVESTAIDAAWVLTSAKKVFDRCMQNEAVNDGEGDTGVYKFEHSGANKALEIIGKHVDVQAFLTKQETKVTLTDDFDSLMSDAANGSD